MTNLENLKKLADGLGADASKCSTNLGALNAISAALGGSGDAQTNAEAIEDIAQAAPAAMEQNVEWADGITKMFENSSDDGIPDMRSAFKKIMIPDTVGEISGVAFNSSATLVKVTLPNNIDITSGAFCTCNELLEVCAPDYEGSVWDGEEHTIGSSFAACQKLRKVRIPYGTTTLNATFGGSTALEEVELPPTLKTMINSAFGGCNMLKSIDIPASVEEIGSGNFGGAGSSVGGITFNIHKPENSISGAPWGASNATVNWLG